MERSSHFELGQGVPTLFMFCLLSLARQIRQRISLAKINIFSTPNDRLLRSPICNIQNKSHLESIGKG